MLKVVSLSSNHDLQNWIMTFWVSSEKWTYKRCEKGFSTSNANIIEKFRLGRDLLQSLNCPPAQSRANLCVAQGFFFFAVVSKISKDGDWALSQDCTTHCKVVFFMSQLEFPLLQLMSIASCPFTVQVWEKSGCPLYCSAFGSGKL